MQDYDKKTVEKAIRESSRETAVYIGCDSRRFRQRGKWFAVYTTVVVLHLDQARGCRIFGFREVEPDFGNVKERMLKEVGYAVKIGYELIDAIGEERRFEIHLDVNPDPKHASSVAVKEAMGYVRGMGMIPRIKPEAPIASTAADFYGKKRVRVPRKVREAA